jgi:hypothetical protein
MKRSGYRRHQTFSDDIDMMTPPGLSIHNSHHHHHHHNRPRNLFGNYRNRQGDDIMLMETTTLEYLGSMEADSVFFEENPARPMASLERSEVEVAGMLGMGEFGVVMNVTGILAEHEHAGPPALLEDKEDDQLGGDESNSNTDTGMSTTSTRSMKQCQSCTALTSLDNWINNSTLSIAPILAEADSIREQRALTNKDLAMKHIRKDLYPKKKARAAKDLAREAKFLASLRHPNIIALWGLVSQPGRVDFGILLDRLPRTLQEQTTIWKEECMYSSQYTFPWQSQQRILDFRRILNERVHALRDIARAMRHLHTKM